MVLIDQNFQFTINLSEKVGKSLFKSGADLKKWVVNPLDSLKLGMIRDRGLNFFQNLSNGNHAQFPRSPGSHT